MSRLGHPRSIYAVQFHSISTRDCCDGEDARCVPRVRLPTTLSTRQKTFRKQTESLQRRERIAVGTQVTLRPPHSSVRAPLRHTAPTLGGDGKAHAWPWVKDLGLREEGIGQLCYPLPRELVFLAAAPQRAQPETHHIVAKGAECREVGRHGVIGEVAPHDLHQPVPLVGDRLMHLPS